MSVLYLTIFVSMMLVLFFVGAFFYHHDRSSGDPLSDELLPFKDECHPAVRKDRSAGRISKAD
jgi:hypothetical protein